MGCFSREEHDNFILLPSVFEHYLDSGQFYNKQFYVDKFTEAIYKTSLMIQ